MNHLFCKLTSFLHLAQFAHLAFAQIDHALQVQMASHPQNHQEFSVYVVLKEQPDSQYLHNSFLGLTHFEKIQWMKSQFKSVYKNLNEQIHLFHNLKSPLQSLWIVNVLYGKLQTPHIEFLAQHPLVKSIHWDAEIPVRHLADDLGLISQKLNRLGTFQTDENELLRNNMNPGLTLIEAPRVWDTYNIYGEGVLLANIDTGTNIDHPDLKNQIWDNPNEIANNNIDDDNNGKIDDIHGWNFVNLDNYVYDNDGHGTATSGQIVGNGAAGKKTGVAPKAKIMILKVSTESQYWQAQQYAIEQKVNIVSSSFSFKWYNSPKPNFAIFRQIADTELALGILHCNSSSNDGIALSYSPIPRNISAPGNVPAPWIHPDQNVLQQGGVSGVIGSANVNALNGEIDPTSPHGPSAWEDIKALDASYPYDMPQEFQDYPFMIQDKQAGLIKPDLAAPGRNTFSTSSDGTYELFGGTSAATPHNAGVAALVLSANPKLSPTQVTEILLTTSKDLGTPGKDNRYGAGLVNAYEAVTKALATVE